MSFPSYYPSTVYANNTQYSNDYLLQRLVVLEQMHQQLQARVSTQEQALIQANAQHKLFESRIAALELQVKELLESTRRKRK